jgi:hypothetical protein
MIFSEDYWKEEKEGQRVVAVSTGLSWPRMAPLLQSAETDYLRPLLGVAMTHEVNGIYWDLEPPKRTPQEREVLRLAQRAVLNVALWVNFDVLSVRISDQGFQRQESDSWHPAYKYQEDNLRQTFRNTGLNAIDQLLEYLEANIDLFPAFEQSPAYTVSKKAIVRNTAEVQEVYDINSSRLVFLRLRPIINQVEELTLQPAIGDTLYDALLAYLDDGTTSISGTAYPSTSFDTLRTLCRKVVVMAAVIQLLRTTGSVTDRGAYFAETIASGGGNETDRTVTDTRLQLLLTDAQRAYDGYLGRLTRWAMSEFADVNGGNPHTVLHRDNDGGKAFWA